MSPSQHYLLVETHNVSKDFNANLLNVSARLSRRNVHVRMTFLKISSEGDSQAGIVIR